MHLFIKIQDLLVDVLRKNPKDGHFQPKMAKNGLEWPKLFFSYSSYIILPKEYPINTDALIL